VFADDFLFAACFQNGHLKRVGQATMSHTKKRPEHPNQGYSDRFFALRITHF
jgi:hypothetical protein